jgi:hypothetical protein
VLNVPVVLGTLMPEPISTKINLYYSFFNYWIENTMFLSFFFLFEIMLVVPVYLKNILVIGIYSYGMFASLARMLLWILIGIPYTLVLVLWDVKLLFNILRMHEGCKAENDEGETIDDEDFDEGV